MEKTTGNILKINTKKKMTKRMRTLIWQLSIIGLVSIIYLISGFSIITNSYSKITNRLYADTEAVNILNQNMYRHQTIVFEHIVASSSESKKEFEELANDLEKDIMEQLNYLGNVMSGSSYETYYHSVYSGIVGYISNVDLVFDFSRNGERETANYYMESRLEDYLNKVNDNMDIMNGLIRDDMQLAKDNMEKEAVFVRTSSIVLLFLLLVVSTMSQIIGFRISDEMVNVDPVTGVYNYSYFVEVLNKKEKKGELNNSTFIAINIKGFQYINQQVGNELGDQVLRSYASLLKSCLQKNDLVARFNGDAFYVLIDNDRVDDLFNTLDEAAVELELNVQEEFVDKGRTMTIKVPSRCGFYRYEEGTRIDDALEKSALALRLSRGTNSDRIEYASEMSKNEQYKTRLIHEFGNAISANEFLVYYQPKVDLNTNTLSGAEALVRWLHDDTIIPPAKFIPILEQEGFIVELDFYVFENVCKTIRNWKHNGLKPVRISTNFSKIHLNDDKFADRILDTIEEYKVDGKYIEIELTESVGYGDNATLTSFVKKLKGSGIQVSIDDFGTGYSSLSMMKSIDVDTVKLDKTFIDGIAKEDHNEDDKKLIANIIRMITDLHKNVLCEGVETIGQAEFLKSVNCYQVQGYLYDRPLPLGEFEKRLARPNY